MRFRLAKILNSLKNIKKCPSPKLCCCCCASQTNSLPTHTSNNNQKKKSIKENLRLFYHTFLYNELNDPMTAVETMLAPFINSLNQFVRIVGVVSFEFKIFQNSNLTITYKGSLSFKRASSV
jgi:hypothetical protein